MKNKLLQFSVISMIICMLLGILLQFTFLWSGKNPIIGIFSTVNESTWEHLKLVFFPMSLTTIVGYFIFKEDYPNFLCARTLGILTAISFIVVFFYAYTGILGTNYRVLDIGSFFAAVILGEYVSYRLILRNYHCMHFPSPIILLFFCFLFILFTFIPPKIPLFKDPLTGTYGIFNKT